MLLNISDLLKKKVELLPFEMEYDNEYIFRDDFSLKLKSPIKIFGSATYDNEIVNLKGNIKTTATLQCSRCLENFNCKIDVAFDENFAKFPKDEDFYPFSRDTIALNEMVVDNLILNMPLKLLCSESCKGLCPVCGIDLNRHQCDCNKDNIDSKFAVLKDLLKGD